MKTLLGAIWNSDRKAFLTILAWSIAVSALSGVSTVMLIPLLNMLQIGNSPLPGWFTALPYAAQVGTLLVSYIVLVAVKAVLSRQLTIRQTAFTEQTGMNMRERLYKAVSGASWESLTAQKDAELISLFTNQCYQVSWGISAVINFISSVVSAAVQLGIALYMSVPVTVLVCVMGVCMLGIFRPLRKKSHEYGEELIAINRDFYGELQNQLSSVKEVRAYSVQEQHAQLFDQISQSFMTARMKYTRQSSVPSMVYSLTAAIMICLVYLVCTLGMEIATDRLVVLVYVFARLWPVFSGFQNQIQNIDSCVPAYNKLMEAQKTMGHEEDVVEEDVDYSGWRQLSFDDVRFSYRDSDEETLGGVSFALRRGEKLALLGRNGAGKTTAVNLLMGFLLPTSGSIRVDDTALSRANIASWRRQVGYVPQDPLILNASVRENLTRFHPGATDEELVEALKKAYAWGFVSKMEQGLDTVLGDRGIRLSGGERQRIVLARVLLGNPSLIVLDEATSALDYESETAFHDVIQTLGDEAAVVLIAHSLATVRMADKAVVLKDGAVVERGDIDELLRDSGSYLSGMADLG
jgi:ATP-binding cassette, subfamily C, bacterial